VLSSELLLHGDPTDWLRRGGATSNLNGALFLVPKRALQQVIAAELEQEQQHEQQQESSSSSAAALPLAVAPAPATAASALALLEKGEGYRVTLPGLLAQAQPQGGGGGLEVEQRRPTDGPPVRRDEQWEER
jgi:hypothetical protein